MSVKKYLIPILIISTCIFCFRIIFNPISYKISIDTEKLGIKIDNSWDISVNDNSISTASIKKSKSNYFIYMNVKKIGTNILTLKDNKGIKYQFLISANKNKTLDIVEDN